MFMLIIFLAGVSLMLALFPDLPLAPTLLLPLGGVGLLRLVLFLSAKKTPPGPSDPT